MTTDLIAQYTASVGALHRQKQGQHFTDSRIAAFMVDWVNQAHCNSIYDPAFGHGVFYRAAKMQGFRGKFVGAEIDSAILEFFKHNKPTKNCTIEQADYLQMWSAKHEAIICNPPYMRFQHFERRAEVFAQFEARLGIKLSGYTNIASAFLIKSLNELAEGGRLAYIMPLEFLNAGYGKLVKKLLLESGSLEAVIKVECEKAAFPDVTTSVGIILFQKSAHKTPVQFHILQDLEKLPNLLGCRAAASVPHSAISPDEKWLKYFELAPKSINTAHLIQVSVYGSFNRGIATGANEYFALTAEQIATLGLRPDEVTPCITRSAQINSSLFQQADFDALVKNQCPVFLLNLTGTLSKPAKKYLADGERCGFHHRYLTRSRKPWYKIEKRLPAPILFGVFSRNRFKVIRNYTQVLNLTCYHGFQPNLFGLHYVDFLFLYFLSTAGQYILSQNRRQYGDALDKFEPNDLNAALCPDLPWFSKIPRADVDSALACVRMTGALSEKMQSVFSTLLEPRVQANPQYKSKVLHTRLPVEHNYAHVGVHA